MKIWKIIFAVVFVITASSYIHTGLSQETPEQAEPKITIVTPEKGNLYVMGVQWLRLPYNLTVILGPIVIRAEVSNVENAPVNFYIDDELKFTDKKAPFEYLWRRLSFGFHTIKVEIAEQNISDSIRVFKIL